MSATSEIDLISVIITSYNQARYLPESLKSVFEQTYQHYEIILVDDGSTDNIKEVAANYPQVKFVSQVNQGPSSARNTGVDNSTGSYVIFLDADDWFFPDALATSLRHLKENGTAAFVSGAHIKVNEFKEPLYNKVHTPITSNHYAHLLRRNYIQMLGTVMYRRWVFDHVRFDATLRGCEDYDFYLKVARRFPVVQHHDLVAVYRRHRQNTSMYIPLMLKTSLQVLKRQKSELQNAFERKCFDEGMKFWRDYYAKELYVALRRSTLFPFTKRKQEEIATLFHYKINFLLKYALIQPTMKLSPVLKKKVLKPVAGLLHKAGFSFSSIPPKGSIRRGDFNRLTPFSRKFGYDRGGPIDRYYIENFLAENKAAIKGRVLEIGDNEYTLKYGGKAVTQSDILHVDENNSKATFVGDLSNAPHLPDNSFDCIILTQTLHLIYNYMDALKTCYRILKPGGNLLITVPGICNIAFDRWGEYWLWSFNKTSMTRMMSEIFPANHLSINSYGNILVATSYLYGVGLPEMKKKEMDHHDPHYQVIISIKATKPL